MQRGGGGGADGGRRGGAQGAGGVKGTQEAADRFGWAWLRERLCELAQPWDSHSLMQRPAAMWAAECVVCQQRRDINRPGEAAFVVDCKQSLRGACGLGDDTVARDSCFLSPVLLVVESSRSHPTR